MDSNLQSRTHPMPAQVAVEELESKLGIQTYTRAERHDLLDAAYDPGGPPN